MKFTNKKTVALTTLAVALTLAPAPLLTSCNEGQGKRDSADSPVRRGEYLVEAFGCVDCHTPWQLGPQGPEPDRSRHLSGHPAALVITEAPPAAKMPWVTQVAATNTAWAGPWGVSFTANLTPHATGLGGWTEAMFIEALRSGRHLGRGRPILPPMPWQTISKLTDRDLKAVFAYLRSLPPIDNKVPEPIAPDQVR